MALSEALSSLARQILLALLVFLLGCGLLQTPPIVRHLRGEDPGAPSPGSRRASRGIDLFAATFAFCLACNALLIAPALVELGLGLDGPSALTLHRVSLAAIRLLTLAVAVLGALAIAGGFRGEGASRLLRASPAGWRSRIPPLDRAAVSLLAAVLMAHLIVAASYGDLNYDTGLYHLPEVLHFLHYGAEPGVANHHFSFGFYNLPLFGQVALQSLSPADGILSPSLNLIFLAGCGFCVLDGVHSSATMLRQQSPIPSASLIGHTPRTLSRMAIFVALVCMFVFSTSDSLVSFNADFAVSITTLGLAFLLIFSGDPLLRRRAVLLALFLPLLKLSGLLGTLFLLVVALLSLFLQSAPGAPRSPLGSFRSIANRKLMLGSLVGSYALLITTSVVTSGHLLFPALTIGPLSAHAVPTATTHYVRQALVSFYARTNDNGPIARQAFAEHWDLQQWLVPFLRTDRGQLMAFWLMVALSLFLVALVLWIRDRETRVNADLLTLSTALVMAVFLALFILPPNPRFFSWIPPLLGFALIELLILRPRLLLALSIAVLGLLSLRLQRPMLRAIGDSHGVQRQIPLEAIQRWRPRAATAETTRGTLTVRSPRSAGNNNRCWAIQPPCTPYLWFLEGQGPVIPAKPRQRGKTP